MVWSSSAHQFESYQSVNEDIIDSEQAPVLESNALLRRSLEKKLKSNNGVGSSSGNRRRRSIDNGQFTSQSNNQNHVLDVKSFKIKRNTDNQLQQYVISSVKDGSDEYIDVMRGKSGESVGALKKTQRIPVNAKNKNFLSIGQIRNSSILTISSSNAKDMKLYRLNSDTEVLV